MASWQVSGRTFGPSTQSPTPIPGSGCFGHLPLLLNAPPSSNSVPQSACSCCPGAALGWGLQARTPATCTSGFFMATALALLLSSLALHSLVIAAGIDIDW